jgi:hypothetical protein
MLTLLMNKKNTEYTKTKRQVLQGGSSPYTVGLQYAFQTDDKVHVTVGEHKDSDI